MDGPQGSRETPTIQVPEVLAMDVSERVIGGRTVRVSACGADGAPTVYASMYEDVGDRVLEGCRGLGCPPFNLVSVSGLDWDSDLSPWQCGPVVSGDDDFAGRAGEYLGLLEGEVVPFAEGVVGTGGARIMAGYSMAGLFALYVPHVSRMFSGSVSASGSLWFPGFADFVRGTPFVRRPDAIYLSIGDRESRTRNPYLRTTEDRTRGLYDHYRAEGIDSVFELNPGNHFRDADLRLAKGISWAVPRCGGTPIIYWDEDDRT